MDNPGILRRSGPVFLEIYSRSGVGASDEPAGGERQLLPCQTQRMPLRHLIGAPFPFRLMLMGDARILQGLVWLPQPYGYWAVTSSNFVGFRRAQTLEAAMTTMLATQQTKPISGDSRYPLLAPASSK